MSYDSSFSDIYKEEKLLRRHGFEQWPGEEELARYLFNVNDKLMR
ncbi:MAG: hypothetical protein RR842_08520 [Gordonibacter sp.]